MSVESAKAFLQKVSSDAPFRKRLEQAPDSEARRQVLKQEGFDFTKEDIKAVTGIDPDDKLSDAQLDKVAGGLSDLEGDLIGAGADTAVEVAVAFAL